MGSVRIELSGVNETLLMPLWGRAVEAKRKRSLLVDGEALRIVDSLDYDFSRIERKVSPISRASWIARSVYFDSKIREYLSRNPRGTIVDLGCGLDTTCDRVDNGTATWYELDFPEVIETRRKLIRETASRRFLAFSVLDPGWLSHIASKENVLLMLAGVIYYFDEAEARRLFGMLAGAFRQSTVILDYCSSAGLRIANKKVIEDGGMESSARLRWGIDSIERVESWDERIKVVEEKRMFSSHARNCPVRERIGMWLSDALSIMSLAEICIE